jgi:glycosyltransferase involved in cell wall biosynthesis
MKILMMSDLDPKSKQGSGAERFLEQFSDEVCGLGNDVYIKTFFPRAPFLSDLTEYDLIHIHNFSVMPLDFQDAILERSEETPPIVFTVHDYTYFCRERHGLNDKSYPCAFFGLDRNICVNCAPFAANIREGLLDAGNVVVADSERMAQIFRKNLDPFTDVRSVLLGIKKTGHQPIEKKRDTFLYMGRHSYEKGIFEMLAAFKGVLAKHRNAKLILTHGGRDSPAIKLQIDRIGISDSVTLTGRISREKMEGYISDALAVLAPSVWEEPFNLTIPEAWSFYRPVIASRMGAHEELISKNGGGILYDPYNISEFSRAMSRLYQHQEYADHLGRLGNQGIELYFNMRRVAWDYYNIYKELV